jgi:Tfp pilus assembly protein PilF
MKRLALSLLLPLSLFLAGCPPKPKPAPKPVAKALSAADRQKVEAHYIAGVYAHAEGDSAKAMASWKKALALDPRHAPTRKAMAEAKAQADALKKLER